MAEQGRESRGPEHGSKRKNFTEDASPRKAMRRLPSKSKETLQGHSKQESAENNTSMGNASKSNDSGSSIPQPHHSIVDQIVTGSMPPPNVAPSSTFGKLSSVLYGKVRDAIAHNAVVKAARNLLNRHKNAPDIQECAVRDEGNSRSETGSCASQQGEGAHSSKKRRRRSRAKRKSSAKSVTLGTESPENLCSVPSASGAATKSTSVMAWEAFPSPPVQVAGKVPTLDANEQWKRQDPVPQSQNSTPVAQCPQGGTKSQPTGLLQPQSGAVQPAEERSWDEDEEMEDLSESITQSICEQQPLVDYKGIYLVTDTNVFLDHLSLVKKIVNADPGSSSYIVCVPWIVVQELDRMRNRKNNKRLSAAAYKAIVYINRMLETKNPKLRGQTVAEARAKEAVMPQGDFGANDDHLLFCVLSLKHQGSRVIMMTNDTNLRNKALIHDVESYKAAVVEKNLKNILAGVPVEVPTEAWAETKPPPLIIQQGCEAVWREVTAILQRCLLPVLEMELRSALGNDWMAAVKVKPPWTARTALECALKHWTDCHLLPSSAFTCTIQPSIKKMEKMLKEADRGTTLRVSSAKLEELFEQSVKVCSHLQLHYFQLVDEVAALKHLQSSWQLHTK